MDYSNGRISENFLGLQTPGVLNESYLGDTNYFKIEFVDSKFMEIKDIQDEHKKSKAVAKLLYDTIQNISAACCKSVHMKELYLNNYKYNHVILKSCDKYLQYVEEEDKKKIRKAIDIAFKGDWRDTLVKVSVDIVADIMVPKEFKVFRNMFQKYADFRGTTAYNALFDKIGEDKAKDIAFKVRGATMNIMYPAINELIRMVPKEVVAGAFFECCPAKFDNIGTALTVYKKSSLPGTFTSPETIKGAKFCFDVTSKVMDDILKLYKKL